jgi:predicted DNA-binding protein with PD1-like motif
MTTKSKRFFTKSSVMFPVTAILMLIASMAMVIRSQKEKITAKRYAKVPAGYLMVLRQGDNVFEELENFAIQENIPSANFSAMGFADVTLGYFDVQAKEYKPKEFKGVELANMLGTIAWQDGKPSIHSHATASDQSFHSFGGHVLDATVGTGTLEVILTIHDKRLERKKDEQLGADVLEIGGSK